MRSSSLRRAAAGALSRCSVSLEAVPLGGLCGAETRHSFHSTPQPQQSAASTDAASISFPREGPGVSYALNWALAAAGVTPAGAVNRNLKPSAVAQLAKGGTVKSASGSKVLIVGSQGDSALAPASFKKLIKQVTTQLSSQPTLFVHDGAVGSSSSSDARVRVIAESAGAVQALSGVLERTPTRDVTAASFPITLYVLPSLKAEGLGSDFVALDPASGLVIAAGSAAGDSAALKSALSAAAVAPTLKKGALFLPGRLVAPKGSKPFVLLAPNSTGDGLLAKSSAWPDLGLIWGSSGVSSPFPVAGNTPSVQPSPSAFVLLTSDSSGALPPCLSLTPSQAAFYYLAGYSDTGSSFTFNPAGARTPWALGAANALSLAQSLAATLKSTGTSAFLVNAHGQSDVANLVTSVVSGKTAPSTPSSSEAATSLTERLVDYVKTTFPNQPEDIAP